MAYSYAMQRKSAEILEVHWHIETKVSRIEIHNHI